MFSIDFSKNRTDWLIDWLSSASPYRIYMVNGRYIALHQQDDTFDACKMIHLTTNSTQSNIKIQSI